MTVSEHVNIKLVVSFLGDHTILLQNRRVRVIQNGNAAFRYNTVVKLDLAQNGNTVVLHVIVAVATVERAVRTAEVVLIVQGLLLTVEQYITFFQIISECERDARRRDIHAAFRFLNGKRDGRHIAEPYGFGRFVAKFSLLVFLDSEKSVSKYADTVISEQNDVLGTNLRACFGNQMCI